MARPDGFEPPTPRFVVWCPHYPPDRSAPGRARGSILEFVCGEMTGFGPGRDADPLASSKASTSSSSVSR